MGKSNSSGWAVTNLEFGMFNVDQDLLYDQKAQIDQL
jgi:hypothetical protein